MDKILRSEGITQSEEYLAKLADRSFLNLWSYPNVYRTTSIKHTIVGKELCDLLVVCGNNVLIFSDKNIHWPNKDNIDIAWGRWYRKAIKDSVSQLRRAERWIIENPDKLFIDSKCEQKFPIPIPPAKDIKIHLIAVALGAHEACSKFFNGDSGSFMIKPTTTDNQHIDPLSPEYKPFVIGDVDSSGSFIHVLNDVSLNILMEELDTITDFTDYLECKANFIRSGNLGFATGEEDLLAYYLQNTDDRDKHGFIHPDHRPWKEEDKVAIVYGIYDEFINSPEYLRRKQADKESYFWDILITRFTDTMIAGQTIVPDGSPFKIADHETGVRFMAHEPRYMRRMLSQAFLGVLTDKRFPDRRFRAVLPTEMRPMNESAYVFLTLQHPRIKLKGGYEEYRQKRINTLMAYCLGILKKTPSLKRVIGIATESLLSIGKTGKSSEDMIVMNQIEDWTEDLNKALEDDCRNLGILVEDKIDRSYIHIDEYPKDENNNSPLSGMNRHQRRALNRIKPKK